MPVLDKEERYALVQCVLSKFEHDEIKLISIKFILLHSDGDVDVLPFLKSRFYSLLYVWEFLNRLGLE